MSTRAPDPFLGFSNGQLRFDALLGRGAMGAVYRGRQLGLDREVAIKIIAPHLADDQQYLERFRREAQALGRQVHPHIITCHDVGPCVGPDGGTVIAMVLEFVDGSSLGELMQRGRLTVRTVLELHAQAASGLAAAHRLGIIHRDIKPDNIMVTRTGSAKLADFGLARHDDSATMTTSGTMLGSPAYMSPEACRGERVGARGDIYSLGCSLFHALTGRTPYETGNSFAAIRHHTSSPIPEIRERRPDLAGLDPILKRLLAKSEDGRPADAALVARELAELARALPGGALAGRMDPTAHADIPLARTLIADPVPVNAAPRRSGRDRADARPGPPATRGTTTPRARWRRDLAFIAVIAGCLMGGGAILTWRGGGGTAAAPPASGANEAQALALAAALAEIEGLIAEKRLAEAAQRLADVGPADAGEGRITPALAELIQRLARVKAELSEAGFSPTRPPPSPHAPAAPAAHSETVGVRGPDPAIPAEPLAQPLVQLVPGIDLVGWAAPPGFAGLPDRLPGGGGAVVLSGYPSAGGAAGWESEGRQVLTLRVPEGRRGGNLLLLVTGQQAGRPLAITAIMGTTRQPLPGTVLASGGWDLVRIAVPAADHEVEVAASGDLRLAVARAVWAPEGVPAPSPAAAHIIPGTLQRLVADEYRFPTTLASVDVALRRARAAGHGHRSMLAIPAADRFAAGVAATLGRALAESDVPVMTYTGGIVLDPDKVSARMADRDLLFVYISTAAPCQLGSAFGALCHDLVAGGHVPVPILGPEAWQGGAREGWDRLLEDLAHAVAGLPVIDLRQVPLFQARHQLPLGLLDPTVQELISCGLIAGVQDLQARLAW